MTIVDACGDNADVLALSIIRSLMAGYATGDVACWEMAHVGAERVLGPEPAAILVAQLTRLVRVLRHHHGAEWHFMPVTCCRVTRDEQAVLAVLDLVRRGREDAETFSQSGLVETEGLKPFEQAVQAAARTLNEIGPHVATGAAPPERASVH